MKKKPAPKSAFFNLRLLIGLAFCSIGLLMALGAFGLSPSGNALARQNDSAPQGIAQQNVPVFEATMTQVPQAAVQKRLVRMVPGSARNWIAVNAVQQSSLNKNQNR